MNSKIHSVFLSDFFPGSTVLQSKSHSFISVSLQAGSLWGAPVSDSPLFIHPRLRQPPNQGSSLLSLVDAKPTWPLIYARCGQQHTGSRKLLLLISALSTAVTCDSLTRWACLLIKVGGTLCSSQPEFKCLRGLISRFHPFCMCLL